MSSKKGLKHKVICSCLLDPCERPCDEANPCAQDSTCPVCEMTKEGSMCVPREGKLYSVDGKKINVLKKLKNKYYALLMHPIVFK